MRRRSSVFFWFYRQSLWWTSRVYGFGGGALWGGVAVFLLSASVSYAILESGTKPAASSRPQLASLLPVGGGGPVSAAPGDYLGPELPDSLGFEFFAPDDREMEEESGALNVRTGRVPEGGTLGSALAAKEIPSRLIDEITQMMQPVFDFRRAQPGDFFALITDKQDRILSFDYQHGRNTIYKLQADDAGQLQARREEVPLERRVVQLGGVVQRSLFESLTGRGEGAELAQDFAEVFVWDIDFSTQTRPGDAYRMVVEKYYDKEGTVSYGKILAAQYRAGTREFTAIYFEDDDGYADYYTPEGQSLRRTFLRAPLRYRRISSRYSKSRLHPVLKVRRPHTGVDYAAPTGTPVWAVADGVVTFKGWSGGFGRLIKIRHNNGYTSYYGHLSSYASNIAVGQRVRQKAMIGRVGSTGLSTGPHLDYRLRVGRRFVDPLKVQFPKGRSVPVKARARFQEVRETLLAELREAQPPIFVEAAM